MLQGFTLVEVLIVIVVISLLVAVIGLVGVKVLHHQKVALTEAIIKNVKIAIDQFVELDPLKSIYDRKDAVTFGPYPPYTLDQTAPPGSVRDVLEPASFNNLPGRLWRDLGNTVPPDTNWVRLHADADPKNVRNDDIRALCAYVKVYVPDALAQVPAQAMKPLDPTLAEYVNPAGTGTGDGAIDVLGIYDAWGVPLNYFLYVKLEWDGIAGLWRVTQRIPVLHSWGITREEYDAEINGTDALDPELWILSDPFPSPAAAAVAWDTGAVAPTGTSATAGWARALGALDSRIVPGNKDKSFGYVP